MNIEQPKGVLVCVTLSSTFIFLTNFNAEAGKVDKKMATKPSKF